MWRSSLQAACYRYSEAHTSIVILIHRVGQSNAEWASSHTEEMDHNEVCVFIISFIVTYFTKPPLLRPYLER